MLKLHSQHTEIDRFWSYNSSIEITLGKLNYTVLRPITQVTYATNKEISLDLLEHLEVIK